MIGGGALQVRGLIEALGDDVVTAFGDLCYAPTGVSNDHRRVEPGGMFVCIKGFNVDGHGYAARAVANGAAVLVAQEPFGELGMPAEPCTAASDPDGFSGAPAAKQLRAFVQVRDTRRALAAASHLFYGEPTKRLKLAGVTGTKGKTTTVYMIRSILNAAGMKTGLLGTVENDVGGEVAPANETTPESVELAAMLAKMVERGCSHAAMEVSSQGLALHRVDFCDFDIGVFTNFSRDHISPNEHKNMDDYLAAKLKLFSMCRQAVINADIKECAAVRAAAAASGRCGAILTYSADAQGDGYVGADIRASRIEAVGTGDAAATGNACSTGGAAATGNEAGTVATADSGIASGTGGAAAVGTAHGSAGVRTRFYVTTPWFSDTLEIALPGRYNVSNALAAIAVCGLLGASKDAVREGLANVSVRGRTQLIDEGQNFTVMVDFAHNATSLGALIGMLREHGFRSITAVFGCGGNRDRNRRFEMGEVSGRMSDFTIVTSDNPRNEDPEMIMADIETGLRRTAGRYTAVADRREAIGHAIKNAAEGDLVLIAGKGHETSQTFADRTLPFDDAQVAREFLSKL